MERGRGENIKKAKEEEENIQHKQEVNVVEERERELL